MRILVTGGRYYSDIEKVREVLSLYKNITLVNGGARGADSLCVQVAKELGFNIETHNAKWNLYGKIAGAIRNAEMVDSDIDLCIAFPGGRGTEDCVRRAEEKGIKVIKIS